MNKLVFAALLISALLVDGKCAAAKDTPAAAQEPHQRVFVLTDVGNEPDDSESLVRLMLYSNQIDIEGIVATTSTHMKDTVHPEMIRAVIGSYGQAQRNLLKHEPGYPTAEHLLAKVSQGRPVYGMAGVGDGKDSPGSEMLVRAIKADDPRPLWVSIWGGPSTLAQALYHLRKTTSPDQLERLVSRLRVYAIADQDDTGAWIRKNFPSLFYIVSPGGYEGATWGAINWPVDGIDNTRISNAWLAANIQQGHGPLGAAYPDVGFGMEGDTPSFLGLIPNGLNAPEHPDWGGWGGRYVLRTPALAEENPNGITGGVPVVPETRPIWTTAIDTISLSPAMEFNRFHDMDKRQPKAFTGNMVTLWRWRDEFQNDFAARMRWATEPYAKANHPPRPALTHPDRLTVHSGESITLDASATTDPDGDSLSYQWFQYKEAGSFQQSIPILADNLVRENVVAPDVDKPEIVHFILRVTDKGTPALTRYKRVIVTILPKNKG